MEGVLLEKAVGYNESNLALFLGGLLNAFVIPRNLGLVTGPDGTVELTTNLIESRMWPSPVGIDTWPTASCCSCSPARSNLAVEVLSSSNTPGEMAVKRQDYFAAVCSWCGKLILGYEPFFVYTSPLNRQRSGPTDTLDGGIVLPGFTLTVQELFSELDRQG